MNLLSDLDVAVLRAAWRVLEDLERVAGDVAWRQDDSMTASRLGRCAGAAGAAESAVFATLSAFAVRADDPRADAATEAAVAPEAAEARAELLAALLGPRALYLVVEVNRLAGAATIATGDDAVRIRDELASLAPELADQIAPALETVPA